MKNITNIKSLLERRYSAKYCQVADIDKCKNEFCTCQIAAETRAYLETVIPEPYFNYSINDFHGHSNEGKKIIATDIANKAKQSLVDYCWGIKTLDEFNRKCDSQSLDTISQMDKRRKDGTNVIIYSDTEIYGSSGKQCGKTFIASLLMKEAIKRRLVPGNHIQQYDWVQYTQLKELLRQDDPSLSVIRSCDWLVVDDITKDDISRKAQSYFSSLIDPFFIARLEDRLPTIFVFRFNIDKRKKILEEEFGVAISKVISSDKTYKISLCEK